MTRVIVRTLIGLLIGAFFVWLSAKDWPVDDLGGSISIVDGHFVVGAATIPTAEADAALAAGRAGSGWVFELWWLLPYIGVLTIIHFLRVIRWRPLLDPIIKLDFWSHNRIGAVGFMAMFLFPLRLGELVRPYLVKQTTGKKVRMSQVMATVVVERIADGLVVSLALFIVLQWLPHGTGSAGSELAIGAYAALAVFVGASGLLAMSVWQHARTARFIDRVLGKLSRRVADKINDLLDAFVQGLRALPSLRAFAWFMFLTLIYWGINGIGVWCMARAFYLPVDMLGCYAMMACVVVGMMIPNSPGNVGQFWYFLIIPMTLYGVSTSAPQAVAFGVVVWLFQLLQQTAFGAWFVIRGKVHLSRVVEATRETETSLTAEAEVA